MNTIIIFLFLYAYQEIHLSIKSFMWVFAVFSAASAIGAYLFGKLTDRINPKRSLITALFLWIAVIFLLVKTGTFTSFLIAGSIGGIALGGVWTANRPMLLLIAPKHSIGEYFGFLEMSGKFAGVIGPVLFGYLATMYNYQIAIYSLLIFFISGMLVLLKIKTK